MKHSLTKDESRLERSIKRLTASCESLLSSNISRHRPTLDEYREKYNLLEFV